MSSGQKKIKNDESNEKFSLKKRLELYDTNKKLTYLKIEYYEDIIKHNGNKKIIQFALIQKAFLFFGKFLSESRCIWWRKTLSNCCEYFKFEKIISDATLNISKFNNTLSMVVISVYKIFRYSHSEHKNILVATLITNQNNKKIESEFTSHIQVISLRTYKMLWQKLTYKIPLLLTQILRNTK